ncbi:unnamed protein product [Polarella glacialis]|uniref:RecA family profile 1 domain-containing protein n=1 Tax=Polarella glacialis TaxID=89957 RepID=A0A813I0Y5_POLGL|nr:unnamed protein product [Polarella glacialis]
MAGSAWQGHPNESVMPQSLTAGKVGQSAEAAAGSVRRPGARLTADAPLEAIFGHSSGTSEAGCGPLSELLRAKRLTCLRDVVHLPVWELRDWLLLPEDQATAVLQRAWAACAAPPVTAWDLSREANVSPEGGGRKRISVPAPLPSLGAALGFSGSLSGAFVEVAGPPGAGKTQFCLHAAALTAAAGGEVFWLDTEHTFSPSRVLELLEAAMLRRLGDTAGSYQAEVASLALESLQRIRHRVCMSLQELHAVVAELAQRAQQGGALPALVVVDSVAAVARNDGDPNESRRTLIPRRQAALSAIASLLKALVAPSGLRHAKEQQLGEEAVTPGVVVTNQVMGDPVAGGSRVTLGHVWHHAVNWRLVLSHLPPGGVQGLGTKERADQTGRAAEKETDAHEPAADLNEEEQEQEKGAEVDAVLSEEGAGLSGPATSRTVGVAPDPEALTGELAAAGAALAEEYWAPAAKKQRRESSSPGFSAELLHLAPDTLQTCRSLLVFLDKKLQAAIPEAAPVGGPEDMHAHLQMYADAAGRLAGFRSLDKAPRWDARAKRVLNIAAAVGSSAGELALQAALLQVEKRAHELLVRSQRPFLLIFARERGHKALQQLGLQLKERGETSLDKLTEARVSWASSNLLHREWLAWCARLLQARESQLLVGIAGSHAREADSSGNGSGTAGQTAVLLGKLLVRKPALRRNVPVTDTWVTGSQLNCRVP